jgi:hypothetical protein
MWLKVLAWLYRTFGWYSPMAELLEYRMLETRWNEIEAGYRRGLVTKNTIYSGMSLRNAIGLEIGMWQATNGFHRPFNFKELKKETARESKETNTSPKHSAQKRKAKQSSQPQARGRSIRPKRKSTRNRA